MQTNFDQDFIVSHAIVNYLHAAFQGEFAAQQILLRFGDPRGSEDEVSTITEALTKITGWMDGLWRGDCLFSAAWRKPETFDAERSINYLKQAAAFTAQLAESGAACLKDADATRSDPQALLTLALMAARYTYARNYYVQGLVSAAKYLKNQESLNQYAAELAEAAEEMKLIDELLVRCAERGSFGPDEAEFLLQESASYPGALWTQVHDMAQLWSPYEGGFNFQQAGFTLEDAKTWYESGFGPVDAGYWRAYDFDPLTAKEWTAQGIAIPVLAFRWQNAGFEPAEAALWFNNGLNVHEAKQWIRAGIPVDQAASFLTRGIRTPDQLPQDEGGAG